MSELDNASGTTTSPGRWSLTGGIGLAALGHALAILAMTIPGRKYGATSPNQDLDAGGRGAVLFAMLCMYVLMHATLLTAGSVFVLSKHGNRGFKRGLIAGWVGGWVLLLGTVVVLVVAAGS